MEYNNLDNLLQKTSANLAKFLEKILPTLFNNWWERAVVNCLSFQQQRRLQQQKTSSLPTLDLAALLRVLDQNWFQISANLNLTQEARHFVKEMQTVRNRWAHAGSSGFPLDDVYRDLDTIQRFGSVIQAEEAFLDEVRELKKALLYPEHPLTKPTITNTKKIIPEKIEGSFEFFQVFDSFHFFVVFKVELVRFHIDGIKRFDHIHGINVV